MISRRKIFGITALTALIARLFFAFLVWSSPYRFYHLITSLDMATHLRFSDGTSFPPLFVAHRLLLQGLRLASGGTHCVGLIFAVQALFGIAGAVLTAELALRLWRDRAAALCAGIIAALYGPYLIFEFAVLQEALLVNLTLGAIVLLLVAREKRYQWRWVIPAALVWLLALAGRPAGILLGIGAVVFTLADRRTGRSWRFAALLLAGFCGASLFNFVFAGNWNPFFSIDYVVAVNRGAGGANSSWFDVLLSVARKIPLLFSIHDISENLNYYFLCGKFPFLKFLPRPEGVVPLAFAGVVALIGFSRFRGRALLPGVVIVLLMAPLAARYPIDRYRLMLVPYFICYAVYLLVAFRLAGRVWWKIALLCGAVFGVCILCFLLSPEREIIRSGYPFAWGVASEAAGDPEEAKASYLSAWRNGGNRGAAQHLYNLLMKEENGVEAIALTHEVLQRYPDDENFQFNQALTLCALRYFDPARQLLTTIVRETDDPKLRQKCMVVLQKLNE